MADMLCGLDKSGIELFKGIAKKKLIKVENFLSNFRQPYCSSVFAALTAPHDLVPFHHDISKLLFTTALWTVP